MERIVSVMLLVVGALASTRFCKLRGRVLNLLSVWIFILVQIVLVGYFASYVGRFASLHVWIMIQLVGTSVLVLILKRANLSFGKDLREFKLLRWCSFDSLGKISKSQLTYLMLVCFAALGSVVLNGIIASLAFPHQWDSLTYHIARVAYYLQNNSLDSYEANYWAQTMHPKVSAVLHAYAFLISGRSEQAFAFLQYSSYVLLGVVMYGIALRIYGKRLQACFVSACALLPVNVIMQATTPQNDLFLTFLTAMIVLLLVEYRSTEQWSVLFLTGFVGGLGLGTKGSFVLLFPSLFAVFVWSVAPAFFRSPPSCRLGFKRLGPFIMALVFPVLLIAIPSGYLENHLQYGHPLGNSFVIKAHAFVDVGGAARLLEGGKNVLRFSMDALALELPSPFWPITSFHNGLRGGAQRILESAGVRLTASVMSRVPFSYEKTNQAHEDYSYWGIMGFGLALPSVVIVLIRFRKHKKLAIFALASVLFVLVQSFCGPYDPWRGRYFTQLVPFAIPCIGIVWSERQKIVSIYIGAILAIAAVTTLSAIMFRAARPLLTFERGNYSTQSFLGKSREQQLTTRRHWLTDSLVLYEQTVPETATVGVRFPPDMYEYPLFGKDLSRTVIPFPAGVSRSTPVDFIVYCQGKHPGVDYSRYEDIKPVERWIIFKVPPGESATNMFEWIVQKPLATKL